MSDCCQKKSCDLEAMASRHAHVLWIVLTINLVMFFLELAAGFHANSTALLADSLDMLGDAVAYGSTIFVLRRSAKSKAKAIGLKGVLMLTLGLIILARTLFSWIYPELPTVVIMSTMSVVALAANGLCLFLLTRFKSDDMNMQSVWLCSRNDIVANTSVLAASGLVYLWQSPYPDLVVGFALAALFIKSSIFVLKGAINVSSNADAVAKV